MNRKDRRKINKKGFVYTPSKEDLKLFEGDLVKLNYNKIISYPNYKQVMRKEYIEFVENHKNDILTVEYDPRRILEGLDSMNYIVQLKEDVTNPKFLFSSIDLILVKRSQKNNSSLQNEELKEHLKNVLNTFKESKE